MTITTPATQAFTIECYTASCAAGVGLDALSDSLVHNRSGLSQAPFANCDLDTWLGQVTEVDQQPLPAHWSALESRNNRLAWLALRQDNFLSRAQQLCRSLSPARMGVIIGTSTSSIGRTEEAYRQLLPNGQFAPKYLQKKVHNMHSASHFVAEAIGTQGPTLTISTACSSSAKVFASAARWLRQGLVDAVVVGGVDSLCLNTLYGFNSLALVSEALCQPFDRSRKGINIGEAAGFALLTREDTAKTSDTLLLLGYGESSDAHHMSHPHPQALGAILAIQNALKMSGCSGDDIDYINLHGTASQANDLIESMALAATLKPTTKASSTKGWTGHTLGAAGILEAVIALQALRHQWVPGTLNLEAVDEAMLFPILQQSVKQPVRTVMSNSFGFGGNNASLVFGARND